MSVTCATCGRSFPDQTRFCPDDGTPLATSPRTRGTSASRRSTTAARGGLNGDQDLTGIRLGGRYQIERRLGGGGMGSVYLAEHVRMRRRCAVKVLRTALANDDEALQRFQREAENASRLSHPNVAQVYDFGDEDGIVYLAMEFIDGESLADCLARERVLHADLAADIIVQSAEALAAAHASGLLHRDVKPDNIMLARNADGTAHVKLVDFGIARAMASDDQKVTRTGLVIGTPEFMAPEQIAGEELDGRCDQYALALVAFRCLTGGDAFPSGTAKENLVLRLTARPRTLREVRGDAPWPAPLQLVFDRALAPDPQDRYAAVDDFARELMAAIAAIPPTDTAQFYRQALEARAYDAASRTPVSGGSRVPTPAGSMTPAGGASAYATRTLTPGVAQPSAAPQPLYTFAGGRSRRRVPWVTLFLVAAAAGLYGFRTHPTVAPVWAQLSETAAGLARTVQRLVSASSSEPATTGAPANGAADAASGRPGDAAPAARSAADDAAGTDSTDAALSGLRAPSVDVRLPGTAPAPVRPPAGGPPPPPDTAGASAATSGDRTPPDSTPRR